MNLQSLVDRKVLTRDGSDWLRTALDPFHDYAENFEGFPDMVSTRSRVQLVSATRSITTPTSGEPYNARVMVLPCYSNALWSFRDINYSINEYLDVDVSASVGTGGPVVCEAWLSGTDPNLTSASAGNLTRNSIGNAIDDSPSRLIAIGFEIHNTTAPVYMAGTATCGRSQNRADYSNVVIEDTSAAGFNRNTQVVRHVELPPSDAATAMLTPGATQWHASEGAYAVAQLNQPDIPIQDGQQLSLWSFGTNSLFGSAIYSTSAAVSASTGVVVPFKTMSSSFDMPYVLLTGLSAESTFQVTTRCYYEMFPRGDDNLITLATPSPCYDPVALHLYGSIARHLPNAVEVKMNPGGEYFRMVMAAIAKVLKAGGPGLGVIHPALPPVAELASMVADRLALENKKKRQPPKLPPKKKVGWGTTGGAPGSARKRGQR
jgi:hypothetical protein